MKGASLYTIDGERNSSLLPCFQLAISRASALLPMQQNRFDHASHENCGKHPPELSIRRIITNGMVRRSYVASDLCMRGLRRRRPMELHTIGIDLGKTVFHLLGLNLRGEVVVRKKFSRSQLLRFTANVRVGLIGVEACGGAHYLGRALRGQGHQVRLIPAQYVKPYVKTNKS